MKTITNIKVFVISLLLMTIATFSVHAQKYVRFVESADLDGIDLFTEEILSPVVLERGAYDFTANPQMHEVVSELSQILSDPDVELIKIVVCGNASPDGLWGNNVELSKMRMEAASAYLKASAAIPSSKLLPVSRNEDWDWLEEMVEKSDIAHKAEVLQIIRTKTWGERKTALRELDGGKVWRIFEEEYFPQMRSVRIGIICRSEKKSFVKKEEPVNADTLQIVAGEIFIKDEVAVRDEAPAVEASPVVIDILADDVPQHEEMTEPVEENVGPVHERAWRMGIKTNIVSDAALIPMGGLEFQIGRRWSFDLQGWCARFNLLCPEDDNMNVYGAAPELRFWFRDEPMKRGSFVGLHATALWYTIKWRDGLLYQNGLAGEHLADAGNIYPAWSVGINYGYCVGLGQKSRWGLEFVVGAGYGEYSHNIAQWDTGFNKWYLIDHREDNYIGITRFEINLTYRFELKR